MILLDTLEQEVTKFRECNTMVDLNALVSFSSAALRCSARLSHLTSRVFQFTEAKLYHNKLVNIRKEMMVLHDKTTKLKVEHFFKRT